MKLTIAKSAGYCFGVKRAVNMVYQEAEEAKVPVYTYGPIIHNEEVVRDLKQRGVHVVRELKELENLPKGKIIIRSHGISRREHEAMKACGFEVLDATCPFVLKIHRLVEKYSKEGYRIVIAGNEHHPEVEKLLQTREEKSTVAFVGDGINDAPVLSRVDVGIAMGALGSDAAIEAADVVLMDDDPLKIAKAIRIARKCLRIVYENICFAIGIKLLCLFLVTIGIANMWMGIFADVGVMVIAVLNAIRALFVKKL